MADQNKLAAEIRTEFGKGFARRLRAAGKIPAVLYGHGTEPVHVALPGHETALIVRHANALFQLDSRAVPSSPSSRTCSATRCARSSSTSTSSS